MVNNSSKDDVRSYRRATRLALLVIIPLALVGGVRAVTWAAATLKVWANGDVLTAADLNANFAALAAEQTPAKVLERFNAAVTAGGTVNLGAVNPAAVKFDLRWMMQHAAAAGACAAASPVSDSGSGHVVLPRPSGVTCTAACAANSGGMFTQCRTSIAIGAIRTTQASLPTDVVAQNYNYPCSDNQVCCDETQGQGLVAASSYTDYCCCYK